ncbi:MAG: exonuclease SbcCD subunit D [Exiguobacterium undae]
MKWIHTADWHLGKIVHGESMLENQRAVLDEFIRLLDRERPDAVIIAGDLYDRAVPPTEAVELLDTVLAEIVLERKIPVVAISGNHDSAERLSFGTTLLQRAGLHLAGKLTSTIEPIEIQGVRFYPVPFADPATVRYIHQDDSIRTHDEAMRKIIGTMTIEGPSVLVGHAFVIGGLETDSERQLSVGTAGQVSASAFAPFTYTALGHLHNPLAIKSDTIRYSGSLLKYSFSEAHHVKGVDILTLNDAGMFDRRFEPLAAKRDLRELTGSLAELTDPVFVATQTTDDYIKINLTDAEALIDPMGKLKKIYPNILHLERTGFTRESTRSVQASRDQVQAATLTDLFREFYEAVREKQPTDAMQSVLEEEAACVQND